VALGSSSSRPEIEAFPAMLEGGSRGVSSSLTGTIYISESRMEFEAFPQVEILVFPCNVPQRHKNKISLYSRHRIYKFDLYSVQQANRFVAALSIACR
jgi:hypothetical protein